MASCKTEELLTRLVAGVSPPPNTYTTAKFLLSTEGLLTLWGLELQTSREHIFVNPSEFAMLCSLPAKVLSESSFTLAEQELIKNAQSKDDQAVIKGFSDLEEFAIPPHVDDSVLNPRSAFDDFPFLLPEDNPSRSEKHHFAFLNPISNVKTLCDCICIRLLVSLCNLFDEHSNPDWWFALSCYLLFSYSARELKHCGKLCTRKRNRVPF